MILKRSVELSNAYQIISQRSKRFRDFVLFCDMSNIFYHYFFFKKPECQYTYKNYFGDICWRVKLRIQSSFLMCYENQSTMCWCRGFRNTWERGLNASDVSITIILILVGFFFQTSDNLFYQYRTFLITTRELLLIIRAAKLFPVGKLEMIWIDGLKIYAFNIFFH